MSQIPKALVDSTLKFVACASLTVKKAVDRVHELEQPMVKAASMRASVLDYLCKQGLIPKGQEKTAEAMLADHCQTLDLLKCAGEKIAELKTALAKAQNGSKQASEAGESVHENDAAGVNSSMKVAGEYNSLSDPHPGRRTSQLKESDKILLKQAGMAR